MKYTATLPEKFRGLSDSELRSQYQELDKQVIAILGKIVAEEHQHPSVRDNEKLKSLQTEAATLQADLRQLSGYLMREQPKPAPVQQKRSPKEIIRDIKLLVQELEEQSLC
ncbi:MAG: hypothetical protein C6Y22_08305 [Hapalosiphonaceae cyanobacterium JJU2]|nr:MAG: hypothetical protein C6Y22_08305 [Hapalosiphonaceae cyanobacterium JJU2]